MRIFCTAAALLLATTMTSMPSIAIADEDAPHRTINIHNHGARCNGTFDDTAAIRRAIDKAPVGGMVLVPPGRCVVSDTIVINTANAVSIVGAGRASQIFQKSNKTLFEFQGVNALVIKDLFLGSAATGAGTSLIKLTNSHHMRIDNVTMLGSYYGLHLNGSILNTMVDLRSGVNFASAFFAAGLVSANQYWVFGERFNSISANANTFIAPVLEGGVNGIWIKDTNGEGSLNITGGTIEGVSGTALRLETTFLPSSITGLHFEANGVADIVLQAAFNVRISAILSITQINLSGRTRNIKISDSMAQNISIDLGDGAYPTGTGAARIILENITTCFADGPSVISPPPTSDPDVGQPNGPSSPVIPNTLIPGKFRKDIIYTNIGNLCGGG
jgi:Pectate lyase superfamily protein